MFLNRILKRSVCYVCGVLSGCFNQCKTHEAFVKFEIRQSSAEPEQIYIVFVSVMVKTRYSCF